MQFIGTIDAKADSKGRVFLPAPFRRSIHGTPAETAVPQENGRDDRGEIRLIMRKDIFEDCLVLYTEEVWKARLNELRASLNVWNSTHQSMLRSFVKDAEWITLDSNGRFLIPKRYLKMADIAGEVTFVGMDDTIEVWGKHKLNGLDNSNFVQDIEALMG